MYTKRMLKDLLRWSLVRVTLSELDMLFYMDNDLTYVDGVWFVVTLLHIKDVVCDTLLWNKEDLVMLIFFLKKYIV